MSCAMIYWGNRYRTFFDIFRAFGAVVDLRPLKGKRVGEASDKVQLHLASDA